jgi:hypothetical protein
MTLGGRYQRLYERQYGVAANLFINPGEEIEIEGEERAGSEEVVRSE